MAAITILPNSVMDNAPTRSATGLQLSGDQNIQSVLHDGDIFRPFHHMEGLSPDESLMKLTGAICQRYEIEFARLSAIQRKFVTHYRCNQCGLQPLYNVNLIHVKRVRCRKCGQLIAFKRTGKYGRLRKEIAIELAKEIQRDGGRVSR